jgi:hypothetical protein
MNGDTNRTVHTIIRTVRDNMRETFDLNTADEFVDILASWVTDAINHGMSPAGRAQTRASSIARDAAFHTLMLSPCSVCGAYVDIDGGLIDGVCIACVDGAEQANEWQEAQS